MATSSFGKPLVIKDPKLVKQIRAELDDPHPKRYEPNPKYRIPSLEEAEKEAEEWVRKYCR